MKLVAKRKPKAGGDPDRPPEEKRKTAPVQIERELARMAAVICAHDDVTITEFLAPVLAPFIRMHYQRVQKEIEARVQQMKQDDQK